MKTARGCWPYCVRGAGQLPREAFSCGRLCQIERPFLSSTKNYWRDITVFYARMFQCYVVFCNRVGDEGAHLRFWGGSHIVDPWGKIVCALPENEEAVVMTEIDLAMVRKRRREVPLVRGASPLSAKLV
jgi:predicted amidohydrolase